MLAKNMKFLIVFSLFLVLNAQEKTTFTFVEFPYKDTTKNEMTYHNFESACEQSSSCQLLVGVNRLRCIRECISPSCYKEIYMPDQLEEGEIDVRLNSFKGCFVQRLNRSRN